VNLVQEHTQEQLLSQVSEIEPYIIKINFEGNIDGADMQSIRNRVEFVLKASDDHQIYFILDLNNLNSIDLEARLCILDRIKSSNKLVSIIIFGLPENKREMLYYLNENEPQLPVFLTENESEALLKARELYSNNKMTSLSIGPSVFTGVSRKEVNISGKSIMKVHDKNWCYTHPDETYYFRIDLIDSDIFISKPSGYLNYKKVLVTNVLFDQVVNRVMGPKNNYFQIIDYSNVFGTTLNVKRNIINNIERTDFMVFYGLSPYMKMVINFSKQFHSKLSTIIIADSYEEALQLVLEYKYGKDYFIKNGIKPKEEFLN